MTAIWASAFRESAFRPSAIGFGFLRLVPEGGVWSLVSQPHHAQALAEQAERLPDLRRPAIITGAPVAVQDVLATAVDGDVRFELIVGRNVLGQLPDKPAALAAWAGLLAPGGMISLAETIVRHTQRLHALLPKASLPKELLARVVAAEEAI